MMNQYSRRMTMIGRQMCKPNLKISCSCACHKTYITMTAEKATAPLYSYCQGNHNLPFKSNLFNERYGLNKLSVNLSIPCREFSRESFAQYMTVDSAPISLVYETLNNIHDITGLPWWGAIALTTFTLRGIVTFPLAIYSTRILAKVQCLQPEIAELAKELKGEVAMAAKKYKWNNTIARRQFIINLRRHMRELYIRDNCHPFKASVLVLVQLPLWICFSLALRNMAGAVPILGQNCQVLTPDLATQGMLWFSNMLVPDSTWMLPILMGMLNLANVELNALRSVKSSQFSKILTNVLRGVSLIMIPIGASVPSCMCFYWTCSSLFSFGQNLILKAPSVRSKLPIPKTPDENDTPYMDMYRIAKAKYSWKKKDTD